MAAARDVHSYSEPARIRVRHVDLDLDVRFENRILEGSVILSLERLDPKADTLVLDTRLLEIRSAEIPGSRRDWQPAGHQIGAADPILGAPLRIAAPPGVDRVRVRYATAPGASGLQWL